MIKLVSQSLYHSFIKHMPIVCVDIIILDEDSRALLVQRADPPAVGQWWLPGGRLWHSETLSECAVRKAQEELGIECVSGPIVYNEETIFEDGPEGIAVHSVNFCFVVYYMGGGDVTTNNTVLQYMWINHIPPNLHDYVNNCLSATGFEYDK